MNAKALFAPAVVVGVLALLPLARLVELPVLVMLVAGLHMLWRHRERALFVGGGLTAALFAAYWSPALLAGVDAVNPAKSWATTLAVVRFLPMALWIAWALDEEQRTLVLYASGAIVAFWAADALFQAAVGFNLLGMPLSDERLNGVFGTTNIKLGHVLAVLSPLAIEAGRRSGRRWLLAGVYGLLLAAIILIGTRAAWIMFGAVTVIYLLVEVREGRGGGRLIAAILAVTTLFATVAYQGSDAFRQRIDRSMLILEGDAKAMDTALSQRLPIWETALAMGSDHWLNGVGVRGFRYAYPDYAASDDPWLNAEDDTGAYHAHQVILELWTETGLIGLLAWLIGAAVAVRAWLRADRTARRAALPYAAGLAAMLFPINSHLAFYSTFWSIVFWWLLALYAGSLGQSGDESPPS